MLLLGALGSPLPAHAQDAATLIRRGNILDAVPATEREALARPGDLDAWERWIDLYRSVGLLSRLVPTVRTRVQRHPADPDAHYLLGRALDDPDEARRAYEAALRINPDHARAWMGVGALERATGTLQDAAAAYQRALRADPSLGEAWGGLIAVYGALGDQEGVQKVSEAAVQAVPDEPGPWLALAAADPAHAGTVLRTAVQTVGWDARVVATLAEQLLREGDAAGAHDAAQRAVRLDPRHRGARFAALVTAEVLQGALDVPSALTLAEARTIPGPQVLARLDTVLAAHPRSVMAHLARANAHPPDHADAALADLEAAWALDPNHPEARASLALRLRADDPARAAMLLAPVVKARPEDPALAAALATARLAAGQAAQALEGVLPAAEAHPFHVELALAHIHARSATGDAEGALAAARALAERLPEPRTQIVWAVAAAQADRPHEAARVYRRLAAESGDARFLGLADQLEAKPGPSSD